MGQLMIRHAAILNDMGNQEESIGQLESAIKKLEAAKDSDTLSRAYNNLGVVMKYQDRLDEALEYCELGILAGEKTENPRNKAYPLANGAECLAKKGDVKKARKWAKEARSIFDKLGEKFMQARLHVIDAIIAEQEGNIDAAEKAIELGISELRALNIPNDLAWELYEAGLMHQRCGTEGARELFEEAETIFLELGNKTLAEKVRKEL